MYSREVAQAKQEAAPPPLDEPGRKVVEQDPEGLQGSVEALVAETFPEKPVAEEPNNHTELP